MGIRLYHSCMSLSRFLLRLALGRRLPITTGELRVAGLAAPATIRRDRWGVPHIDAASDADAAFALGFCQGQDRAGQLEVFWRVGRGRLAEWVGAAGVKVDRMSRRIGFRRAAEAQLPVLDEAGRQLLEAYARGVSAGHTIGLPKKPHEFAIVGGEPSTWDAADVLTTLKVQAFFLSSNWDVELARLRLLLADGPDAVRELDPVSVVDPTDALRVTGVDAIAADLAALHGFLPGGGGSNNWAIAGSRTTSGKPLLANDPHLGPLVPPPWYLAHVRTPEGEIAGATFAGASAFPVGHNGFAAWGITAGLTDNTDLFLETLGPDRVSVREADGSFTPCRVLREIIRVKKAADVIEEVMITPRGPVIGTAGQRPHAIAMRAVWLDPLPVVGLLGSAKARSFEQFRRCYAEWPAMPLNVVYADIEGNIGWQLGGQVPRRLGGNGLLPRPGDAPDTGWAQELVPFDEMPFVMNPAVGFVATANAIPAPVSPGYEPGGGTTEPAPSLTRLAPWLGADFLDPFRLGVIRDELGKRSDWDASRCIELQLSTRSLPWERVRDTVLSLPATDAEVREGLHLLREWDGHVTADSTAAAVYELFVAELSVRVARAKAPNGFPFALGQSGLGPDGHSMFAHRRVGHLMRLIENQPTGWFSRGWPAEMADALAGVVRKLRHEVGPASAFWSWGHLRTLRLAHPMFGKSRLLRSTFNLGPVPVGGDSNTVAQAGVRPMSPTANPPNIANLRAVFDLADLSRSVVVLCGGQSGNPCSPHYADQFPLWQAGETITLPWEQDRVIREAKHVLRLVPNG